MKDPEILDQIDNYFSGFLWGAPATLLLFGDEQFSLGLQDPKAAGFFGTFYAGISSLLAYPLAMGKWGAPRLGVRGIGYAMSIGPWVAWVAMRVYYAFSSKYEGLDLYNFKTLTRKPFKKYLEYSIPLGLTNSIGLLTNFFVSLFTAGFSRVTAEAFSAASAYFTQLEIILLGSNSAISAKISNLDPEKIPQNYREAVKLRAKKYMLASIGTSVGLVVLCSIPALGFQDVFINFFASNSEGDFRDLSKKYLWAIAGQEIVEAYSNALEAILHGLKDIAVPFYIDVGSDALKLASVGIVAKYSDNAVWLVAANSLASVVTALAYSARMHSVGKRALNNSRGRVSNAASWFTTTYDHVMSRFKSADTIEEAFED